MDRTGLGEYVYEDMAKALPILNGVKFTVESKQAVAQSLRKAFVDSKILFPYDPDLIEELHSEHFQLNKTGNYLFTHPEESHDDRFWSLALAVAAASQTPRAKGLVAFGEAPEKI
jgi:phage FluMu gp28-like protein